MLVQPPMSHAQTVALPTSDASFQFPADMTWEQQPSPYSPATMDVITWNYYTLPPSPAASTSSKGSPELAVKNIRPPLTPESLSEGEQPSCIPTHQVFDLADVDVAEAASSPSPVSPPPSRPRQLSISTDSGALLKKSFTTISGVRKGRGNGERITTKDFVPPDVTGLSKREARLLKNRAAAFLSRQRKREEFEAMEIRVKELEEESSRLQPLAEKGRRYDQLLSEMEELRLRLSAAEKREQELTVELANKSTTNLPVKTESRDHALPPSPYSPYTATCQNSVVDFMKQSLLAVLPSLLSLPPQTPLPVTISVPSTGRGAARPLTTPLSHQPVSSDAKEHGRQRNTHVGVGFGPSSVDVDSPKKVTIGAEPPAIRGSLSISLDVVPTDDGRGCVRAHVSEFLVDGARFPIHSHRPRASSLGSWPGSDATFALSQFASPLSAPFTIPSTGGLDQMAMFIEANNSHNRMVFDPSIIPPTYPPFGHHSPDQTFDYYPGFQA